MEQDPWLVQFEARHNERVTANRTFLLLGEKLTVKPAVAPEAAQTFTALQKRLLDFYAEAEAAKKAGKEIPLAGIDDSEMLDTSETTIRRCLEPGSLKAWAKLRDPDLPNPLTVVQIYRLADYILTRASGLPTDAPAGSSTGRTPTANSSKAASPSRARTRKT